MRAALVIVVVIVILPGALAACGPTYGCPANASCLGPVIFVSACTASTRTVNGVDIGGVEDCVLRVGGVGAVDDVVDATFRVTNPAAVSLALAFSEDADEGAALSAGVQAGPPEEVLPGLARDVVVRVRRARADADATRGAVARVIVHSNADNTPDLDEDRALRSRIAIAVVAGDP